MVGVAFRESAVAGGVASASGVMATLAHGAQAGEVLLAFVQWQQPNGQATLAQTPAGWALVQEAIGSAIGVDDHLALYRRQADAPAAGLAYAFAGPVGYPYLALLAYTRRGASHVALGDSDAAHRQLAGSHTYGALSFTPQRQGSTLVYCFAVQAGSPAVFQAPCAATPDLRAGLDGLYVFDGSPFASSPVALSLDLTTNGLRIWDALACEVWCSDDTGLHVAGASFVPDRVYEDLGRRVLRRDYGIPSNRN